MKKLLLIVALLTISLTLTFGQASVGGWGRGIFVPIVMADDDPASASMVSWGPGGTRMGFTVSGSSDNVGVQMDVIVDGGAVNVGDQQKIWVKPIEMLTLSVGRAYDDTLRGSAGFVAYNWLRLDSMVGDGLIFGRVGEMGPANFIATVTPVDGAFLFAAFGGNGAVDLQNPWPPITMEDMFKYGQYGGGYDIAGIGMIRAQLFGRPPNIADDWFLIQAAFKLTMIEGLMVDVGGTFPTSSDEAGMVAGAAIYVNYVMDTLTLHVVGDLTMYDGTDPAFGAGLGVEYGLEGGPTIQGDVRYRNDVASGWADGEFGVGAFAKFSYSNGIFGIGAQMTNGNFANWGGLVTKTATDAMVFAIPLRLEYWF